MKKELSEFKDISLEKGDQLKFKGGGNKPKKIKLSKAEKDCLKERKKWEKKHGSGNNGWNGNGNGAW